MSGHFRHLGELYDRNDLGVSAKNLRKDRERPTDILDRIDKEAFTEGLRKKLEILNRPEQRVAITEAHRAEIREYLDLLDLTVEIPTEYIPVKNDRGSRTVISQPGLRYAQAKALISQLLNDAEFQSISAVDRAAIRERILNEIRGRMMEEIVLLETKMAFPKKQVCRLQFQVGEFDMVVIDQENCTCEAYELKHSRERVPGQYRFLADEDHTKATEFRFGTITKKAVIYRGEDVKEGEIAYLNVEKYLKGLAQVLK